MNPEKIVLISERKKASQPASQPASLPHRVLPDTFTSHFWTKRAETRTGHPYLQKFCRKWKQLCFIQLQEMDNTFLGQDFVFTFKHSFINTQVPRGVKEPTFCGNKHIMLIFNYLLLHEGHIFISASTEAMYSPTHTCSNTLTS